MKPRSIHLNLIYFQLFFAERSDEGGSAYALLKYDIELEVEDRLLEDTFLHFKNSKVYAGNTLKPDPVDMAASVFVSIGEIRRALRSYLSN